MTRNRLFPDRRITFSLSAVRKNCGCEKRQKSSAFSVLVGVIYQIELDSTIFLMTAPDNGSRDLLLMDSLPELTGRIADLPYTHFAFSSQIALARNNKNLARELPMRRKSFIRSGHFTERRSKHEDHLPIMSLRWRKQGDCQRLSKSRSHALVLPYFARDAVYNVAAIEGRPISRVSTVPRSKRSAAEKKRMEGI